MAKETPMTFVELMKLTELRGKGDGNDKIDEMTRRFTSLNGAFEPGGGSAYGGHVYAQSVWAAAGTVGEGMFVHNVHGFFTLPGLADRPFIYEVSNVSSGRSYCTRYVTARQPLLPSLERPFGVEESQKEMNKPCFAGIVSFKRDESKSDKESKTGHQIRESVQERFKDVLEGLTPEELHRCPNLDTPWYWRRIAKEPQRQNFPGLEMRKVNMTQHNSTKHPSDWTNLNIYRPIGILPLEDYNLHACAHIYASDRNSLYIVSNAVGFGDEVGTMGSLSHSVVLHVPSEELLLRTGEWWIQEAWTPRSGQGRGMHESRIWDPTGRHIASSWQEGMVRRAESTADQKQRLYWEEGMRRRAALMGEKTRKGDLGKHKL